MLYSERPNLVSACIAQSIRSIRRNWPRHPGSSVGLAVYPAYLYSGYGLTSRIAYSLMTLAGETCILHVNMKLLRGSILGPLLFSLYVFYTITSFGLSHVQCADGISVVHVNESWARSSLILISDCFRTVRRWFLINGMSLNPDKLWRSLLERPPTVNLRQNRQRQTARSTLHQEVWRRRWLLFALWRAFRHCLQNCPLYK